MNELDFADAIIEEAEIDFEPFYNQHFIEVDEQNRIVKGWSDAFAPATENSIVSTNRAAISLDCFLMERKIPAFILGIWFRFTNGTVSRLLPEAKMRLKPTGKRENQ